MRIVMLAVDWKDEITADEINNALDTVGGRRLVYPFDQSMVDSKIMYVSSHELGEDDLYELFETADLNLASEEYIEGKNIDNILKKLKVLIEEEE